MSSSILVTYVYLNSTPYTVEHRVEQKRGTITALFCGQELYCAVFFRILQYKYSRRRYSSTVGRAKAYQVVTQSMRLRHAIDQSMHLGQFPEECCPLQIGSNDGATNRYFSCQRFLQDLECVKVSNGTNLFYNHGSSNRVGWSEHLPHLRSSPRIVNWP